jgi:uncharacterized membrane protein
MLNKLQICIVITNPSIMNLKRIFGAVLTILGIIALIYSAYTFANTATASQNVKQTVIYGVIGLIFFVSGIGLIKTTKDEA